MAKLILSDGFAIAKHLETCWYERRLGRGGARQSRVRCFDPFYVAGPGLILLGDIVTELNQRLLVCWGNDGRVERFQLTFFRWFHQVIRGGIGTPLRGDFRL